MARADTRALGSGAERIAEKYLSRKGLVCIQRNFRCRLGEIDLIARDERQLVFIEVCNRGRGSLSRAVATVDSHKQRKLVRTAALFIAARPQYANNVMRFDVVAIDEDESGKQTIAWLQDAFRPADSRL